MMFIRSFADFNVTPWAVQVTVGAITVTAQGRELPGLTRQAREWGLLPGHQRGPTVGHQWGLWHGHGQRSERQPGQSTRPCERPVIRAGGGPIFSHFAQTVLMGKFAVLIFVSGRRTYRCRLNRHRSQAGIRTPGARASVTGTGLHGGQ